MTTSPELLKLVALWCPEPPRIHPRWRELAEPSIAWGERVGMLRDKEETDRMVRAAGDIMTARGYPNAEFERLRWMADLLVFLFWFDDTYCDEGDLLARPGELAKVVQRATFVLQSPHTTVFMDEPYCAALRDIRLRMADLATPSQIFRWTAAMSRYLGTQVMHAAYREAGVLPSVEEFFAARLDSSGAKVLVVLNDIVEGFEVAPDDFRRPHVQAVVESAAFLIGLANDLFSYNHERLAEEVFTHDLIDLCVAAGATIEEAVMRTVAEYEQVMRLHLALVEQTLPTADENLRRYLTNCSILARANHDWSMAAPRYVDVNPDPPAELTVARPWVTHRMECSEIATFGWWWDLLAAEDFGGRAEVDGAVV